MYIYIYMYMYMYIDIYISLLPLLTGIQSVLILG